MFDSSNAPRECMECRASLEDCLSEGAVSVQPGSALAAHLDGCEECRRALDDAVLASRLMIVARETAPEASEVFVTRMMALVREAAERDSAVNAIWRPLEFLASRFAVAAAVVLLALSVYLAEFAPGRPAIFGGSAQTEIGAGMPEPPAAPPSDPDDVLMSIAEMPNGN